jgi:hypothetical protein
MAFPKAISGRLSWRPLCFLKLRRNGWEYI